MRWATTREASGALYALLAMLVGVYRSRGMDLRAPIFSTLEAGVFSPEREMGVLVATLPANSSSTARSATASMSSSERSARSWKW